MHNTEIEIVPAKSFSMGLKELWKKKELLYYFAWRDIKVKYKQTSLGVVWVILQPLMMMAVFYFIFSRALHVRTGRLPYIIYSFSGLILWGLFSNIITNSSDSMLVNSNIVRKIYFPRIIIPLSSILVALLDFTFGILVLLLLFIGYQQHIALNAVICFPIGILMTTVSSFGIGSLLAALNVKYRDFRYLLPFLMQLLFFSSQVVYSISEVQTKWLKYLLYCHPLNGALEIFMYPLQPDSFDGTGFLISLISSLVFCIVGLRYFKKTENYFADLL